jgi:hypothetical protein
MRNLRHLDDYVLKLRFPDGCTIYSTFLSLFVDGFMFLLYDTHRSYLHF